jgi:acyl-coenzyme A synthetase/AMP-(fatty) acid ligase
MMEPSRLDSAPRTPSTADYVAFHAAHSPGAIALVEDGIEISYARFHADLRRFTQALAAFGLARGSLVSVSCARLYIHWLLLLGWENLGVTTASFVQGDVSPTLLAMLKRSDLAMSDHELPLGIATAHCRLDDRWVEAALAAPVPTARACADLRVGMADVLRIRRSSGTTGGAKMMAVTRQMEESRLHAHQMALGYGQHARLLLVRQFVVGGLYVYATVCLRLGATCLYETRFDTARAIAQFKPTHALLFQLDMAAILEQFETEYEKPEAFTVIITAAPLGDALRARVLRRLATEIVYHYSANEISEIAYFAEDGIATLLPGVRAEVIDEHDQPVEHGRMGRLRVRTPCMVTGYLENSEASARTFRDGWFYSGDAAIMVDAQRLKIVGRIDEVLNIGGLKLSPEDIEDQVRKIPGVIDVGMTAIRSPDGVDRIGLAVVLAPDTDMEDFRDGITREMSGMGDVRVMLVAEIPRTPDTGKVRREPLKALFAAR